MEPESETTAVVDSDPSAETMSDALIAAVLAPSLSDPPQPAFPKPSASRDASLALSEADPERTAWRLPVPEYWGIREAGSGDPTAEEIYREWGLGPLLPEPAQHRQAAAGGPVAAPAGIRVPAEVTIIAGQMTRMPIRWSRDDTPLPFHLEFRKLPRGVSVVPAESTVATDHIALVLSASDKAAAGNAEALLVWTAGSREVEVRFVVKVVPPPPRSGDGF
jgi:hypothetical protein